MNKSTPLSFTFDHDLKNGFARAHCPSTPIYHGMVTDGLSGPWIIRGLFRRWDQRTILAAIIHDRDYYLQIESRQFVDKKFYKNLLAGGEPWIMRSKTLRPWRIVNWYARCILAYWSLRAFGWIAWRNHAKSK